MEIHDIKQNLSILTVLAQCNLNPDKNHRLCCPFHEDKTPSMQVYPKTNTVFCFSSNCQLHGKAIDSIDFIMHKEKVSKHEALKKAESLINIQTISPLKPMQAAPVKEKNLTEIFKQLQTNLGKSQPAKAYLQSRCLKVVHSLSPVGRAGEGLEVGYNVTTIEGLKHCVVFALRNKNNEVTGLYGRSIYNNSPSTGSGQAKHFYLKESSGLYPTYPHPDTQKLIIAESIIDTASLQQISLITDTWSLLACYGTNRLNEEMKAAISELKHLKEIVFAFDNDKAGNAAVEKYAQELNQLLNTDRSPSPVERDGVRFGKLNLPCNDVNETLVAHNEEVFIHLLNERTFLFQLKK